MKRILAVVLLLVLALRVAAAKDTAAEEAKLRTQVAAEVAKAAAACIAAGAKTESEKLVAEATALDPAAPGVADAKDKSEALDADAAGADAAAAKARAAARSAVAKLYDKLAALDHEAKDDARFDGYLMRALEWEPKPRAAGVVKKAKDGLDSPQPWTGARLLAKLRKADPEGTKAGKYDAIDIDLGKSNKLMLASADELLVAWVSLPKDWARGKKYPVLVGVEGAGCSFQGYFNASVAARGSRSVIVVTPVSLSNANVLDPKTFPMYPADVLTKFAAQGDRPAFDGPGVQAILDDLEARFGAEPRAFQTGFSGGGMFTYWRTFMHPDKVRGAAPCCGNFNPSLVNGAPEVKDGGPPVHIFTGEKDGYRDHVGSEPGIEAQSDNAQELMKKLGYTRIQRTMVQGAGHSALHAQVWEFVDEVLRAK